MTRRAARRAAAVALLGTVALATAAAAVPADRFAARASVSPPRAHLGDRVTSRGQVVLPPGAPRYRWVPPDSSGAFSWGAPRARLARGGDAGDTLQVEIPLQVFETGRVTIPGLALTPEPADAGAALALPVVHLEIESTVPAADTAADLRPLRGPIAAPWWERVPWAWVAGGAVLLALAGFAIARLRRRRPEPVAVAAPADPAAEARAALAALRLKDLPGRGQFVAHALELSHIARRFLEATRVVPKPGDSTPELLAHLRDAGFTAAEVEALAPLLRHWDRIKYARAATTVDDARGAERAVDDLIGHAAPPPSPGPAAGGATPGAATAGAQRGGTPSGATKPGAGEA